VLTLRPLPAYSPRSSLEDVARDPQLAHLQTFDASRRGGKEGKGGEEEEEEEEEEGFPVPNSSEGGVARRRSGRRRRTTRRTRLMFFISSSSAGASSATTTSSPPLFSISPSLEASRHRWKCRKSPLPSSSEGEEGREGEREGEKPRLLLFPCLAALFSISPSPAVFLILHCSPLPCLSDEKEKTGKEGGREEKEGGGWRRGIKWGWWCFCPRPSDS